MKPVLASLLLSLVLVSSPAWGQDARSHFERGTTYQVQARYAEAIAEYEQAYALEPFPDLLYNIAQCHRLNGDKPAALEYYRRFLAASPEGRGSAEARRFVASLEAELPPPVVDVPSEVKQPPEPAKPVVAPPPAQPVVVPPPAGPRDEPGWISRDSLRWSGIGLGAAGVVSLGLGAYFAYETERLEDEVSDANPWSDEYEKLYADGKDAERNMKIAYIVGASLAVTGTALFVTSWYLGEPGEPQTIGIAPALGPGTFGGVVQARF